MSPNPPLAAGRRAAGLYDPAARARRLRGGLRSRASTASPRHEVVELALRALDDLEHRGAAGRRRRPPATAPASCSSSPTSFLRARARGVRPRAPRTFPTRAGSRSRCASCPPTSAPGRARSADRGPGRRAGRGARLARGAGRPRAPAARPRATSRRCSASCWSAPATTSPTRTSSSAASSSPAGSPSSRPAPDICTSRASPRGRSSTRACSRAPQLARFYADLRDPELQSPALAVVHSRFSTNTFPSWELAQPLRLLAHNGEINTLAGNVNWMRAREATLHSNLFGAELAALPAADPGGQLRLGRLRPRARAAGRSPAGPAPGDDDDDPGRPRDQRRHAAPSSTTSTATTPRVLEPWDGPAAIVFSDGRVLGACLDRNGLRPGRWLVTDDGLVVLGSEAGVLPVDPAKVERRGRLHPGRLFIVDLERGCVARRARGRARGRRRKRPYGAWCRGRDRDPRRPRRAHRRPRPHEPLRDPPARLRLHARRTCGC